MVAVVRNYTHMSTEEIYNLTESQLKLEYFFACKNSKLQAKLIGAAIMGGV